MNATKGHLILDEHVASVLEFMESHIPADRLEAVAQNLPTLARVLWGGSRCAQLFREPIRGMQPNASESALAATCAGDGSVGAGDRGVRT